MKEEKTKHPEIIIKDKEGRTTFYQEESGYWVAKTYSDNPNDNTPIFVAHRYSNLYAGGTIM